MVDPAPRLVPPPTRGHVSVATLRDYWYVACRSRELRGRPRAVEVLGQPLVLFRDGSGQPRALLDRCPHRNVPLSLGRVRSGRLQCAYHGWEFEGDGRCARVPALRPEAAVKHRARAHACRELDGLVWVYGEADAEPERQPYRVPHVTDTAYTTAVASFEVEGSLHALVENTLDVPHTAFLHGGLFRVADRPRRPVTAVVRRGATTAEAEFIGEAAPPGIAGKLLAPAGGTMQHWDRFLLPSIAQVEYRMGDDSHFLLTSLCTPVSDFRTRLVAVGSYRLPGIPGGLLRPVLELVARRIFAQDGRILRRQTAAIRRFGGESFASTEVDLLGSHIWRLLREAERRTPEAGRATVEERVELHV